MLKYKETDSISDLATKILQRFNKIFLDAIRQIGVYENKESASDLGKMFEYRLLKTQLTRVAIYLAPSDGDTEKINNKKCMLHLLCSMLKLMQPDKVET